MPLPSSLPEPIYGFGAEVGAAVAGAAVAGAAVAGAGAWVAGAGDIFRQLDAVQGGTAEIKQLRQVR
jgi:hypothetical protein